MVFLEASHISLIQFYLCQKDQRNFLEELENNKFNIIRGKIESWNELNNFIGEGDIFSNEKQNTLIDLQDLQPSIGISDILGDEDNTLYFFSSSLRSWPAATQKIWTSMGGEYIKLAFQNNIATDIYLSLSRKLELHLSSLQINKLISSCTDYQELIDKIELLHLSPNKEKSLDWISPEISQELFTLQLRPNNLQQDLQKWLTLVKPDDIQLALSLLWTKANKIGNSELKNLVLKCDQDIKTKSKLSPSMQYKKLLFDIGLIKF
jgi:hypothetical protein